MENIKLLDKIELVNIKHIREYENNPKKHPKKQIEKIKNSIKEFGFTVPIILDNNNEIIAGHGRYLASKSLGIEKVPCIKRSDLNEMQVKALRLADNKIAESDWDIELLANELEEILANDYNNINTGFDKDEIGNVLNDFEDEEKIKEDDFDDTKAYDEIKEPISKLHDIWELNSHRLICGDATKISHVERLMNGKLADAVFTDPPYNVDYEGKTKDKLKIKNDTMEDDDFYNFLYDSFTSMNEVSKQGAPIYICHADSEGHIFRKAMIDSCWLLKQCIIWAKNTLVMGRQDYHWKHEPILYGWKGGSAHKWYADRKKTTLWEDNDNIVISKKDDHAVINFYFGLNYVSFKVPSYEVVNNVSDDLTTLWRIDRPQRSSDHPTKKPIKLVARALINSSMKDDIILDLFGGSGSTLISAEQLDRVAYLMELDPKYVDVIIKRFVNYKLENDERINLKLNGEEVDYKLFTKI